MTILEVGFNSDLRSLTLRVMASTTYLLSTQLSNTSPVLLSLNPSMPSSDIQVENGLNIHSRGQLGFRTSLLRNRILLAADLVRRC